MLDARELRIGNWIQSDGDPSDKWQIDKIEDGYTFVEGIPLTPEILVKCGFRYVHEFYTIDKDLISFIFNEGKLQCTYVFIDTEFRQIKFLHELQNLYYSLTGEELQIKDSSIF